MSKIIPEKITILQVKLYRTNLDLTDFFLSNPAHVENFRVNFGHDTEFDFESKSIRIRLEIMLEGLDEKEELIGIKAEYGIEFVFHVENLEEFISETDSMKAVDSILGITLLSMAYSTSRGIVLQRTQGTYFDGIILPVVDPKELLQKSKKK